MNLYDAFQRPGRLLLTVATVLCLFGASVAADDDPGSPWSELGERSREALTPLMPQAKVATRVTAAATPRVPQMIVVGFTGGREGRNSRISGVVQLRKRIEASVDGRGDVAALTFNNRDWREAAREVLALIDPEPGSPSALAAEGVGPAGPPLIVAYGHSWGAGAVTKFARLLGERDIDVGLAVYIDAFSLRNPRVPANVHYAVNLYQRTGIFRGFPLRGKSKLVLESPESTEVLANLRITPNTSHFGWHWNLVQPLLYRHHHRMSHDLRLQRYLLDIVALAPELVDADGQDDVSHVQTPAGTGSFLDLPEYSSQVLEPAF
jgi:hypothetical protein